MGCNYPKWWFYFTWGIDEAFPCCTVRQEYVRI